MLPGNLFLTARLRQAQRYHFFFNVKSQHTESFRLSAKQKFAMPCFHKEDSKKRYYEPKYYSHSPRSRSQNHYLRASTHKRTYTHRNARRKHSDQTPHLYMPLRQEQSQPLLRRLPCPITNSCHLSSGYEAPRSPGRELL